jgi:hypothetical protein
MLGLNGPDFPVETGPNATVRVFRVVRAVAIVPVRFQPGPGPEPRIWNHC